MPVAVLTRPQEDSGPITAELQQRGFQVVSAPLLTIAPLPHPRVSCDGVQGILVTSANGIRTLAPLVEQRDVPVWTVGDASARACRDMGFTHVTSAGGDVDSLAALITRQCHPNQGTFLHAAGSVVAGDLGGQLATSGFHVRRLHLYEARTAQELSPDFCQLLADGTADVVLFYSPRTAATFVRLVEQAALGDALTRIMAYCLSAAVAEKLRPLPWGGIRIAAQPTQAALLAALDEDREAHDPA